MVEKSNVPEIRFAGFADPWEQRKLGNELLFLRNNTLSRADLNGVQGDALDVHYGDVLVKYGAVLNVAKTTLPRITKSGQPGKTLGDPLNDGDIIMSDTAEDETAGKCSELCEIRDRTVYSGLHTIPCRPRRKYASGFLGHYLNAPVFHNQLIPLMQGIKVISLSKTSLSEANLVVPSIREQEKISATFSRLDTLITLHQRKYDKLGELKKSLLEKMFPKEGEVFPEIRFAGFADPWEQRKLGELADSFEYGLNVPGSDFDGIHKYLRITDIDDETHRFNESDLTSPLTDLMKCEQYRLAEGDLLFARTGASVGKTYLYQSSDGLAYYAGFLIRAHIHDDASADFVFQSTLTERYRRFVSITSQRSGQPGINAKEYSEYEVPTPSLSEQRLIGRLFSRLDALITLHQRKLELLRNIKKALLDKMFVEGE